MKFLIAIATITLLFAGVVAKESRYEMFFGSSSQFMKGFETGVLLRSKKDKTRADFGCSDELPPGVSDVAQMIDSAKQAMETMGHMMKGQEKLIKVAVQMFKEFFVGIGQLINAFKIDLSVEIDPKSNDIYCRGMTFGLEGSKMLVKIANIVMRELPAEARRGGRKGNPNIIETLR